MDQNITVTTAVSNKDVNLWSTLAHLGFFIDFLCPLLGSIAVLGIMLTKGKEHPTIYENSRIALNSHLTSIFATLALLILIGVLYILFLVITGVSISTLYTLDPALSGKTFLAALGASTSLIGVYLVSIIVVILNFYLSIASICNAILASDGKETSYLISYDFIKKKV